jgi:hypothetical protein
MAPVWHGYGARRAGVIGLHGPGPLSFVKAHTRRGKTRGGARSLLSESDMNPPTDAIGKLGNFNFTVC